jgi:PAS domain S-box-containing protein
LKTLEIYLMKNLIRPIQTYNMENALNSWVESQYARSLIEAIRDPLFTISAEGKITDVNQAAIRVTELSREELINLDFYKCFTNPAEARKCYQEIFDKSFVIDFPLVLHDGKPMDVLCNGSVYKSEKGEIIGVVLVARDVTDKKVIEQELIEAKVFAELATGIAEQAQLTAESSTRIAEDAVRAKQQFLSNMSHEIRTPMNAIIGFTKVLLRTELTEKQKEYLNAIELSGGALIVLINDILDLAKVDAGKMSFEQRPFNMASSIAAMLHLFEPKIREKILILVKEYDNKIPNVLLGDSVRLHQIILNLVSNAVKFTSEGEITVSVKLIDEDDKKVNIAFSVKDTGIGIDDDKIINIFENFQQATSGTSRLYGGTGLGLAIVKQLVETQNGTVSVKSKPQKGSTFSFELTFLKTDATAELELECVEPNAKIDNLKILVVEDIALNQLLMKTLLDDFGFEYDMAANGKIAIEKLRSNTYDLILMDLQMPEMNGFEATEYIRNEMKLNVPIMALTADVTTVDLAKCKAVGMNDYVAKPVDDILLHSKILKLVKKNTSNIEGKKDEESGVKKLKCCNLDFLAKRTKSNPELMMEMIVLYIDQTEELIKVMNTSLKKQDWGTLQAAAHKMIPSFSIMGIKKEYETIARQIQEYARNEQHLDKLPKLVLELTTICKETCEELKEELITIKENKQ